MASGLWQYLLDWLRSLFFKEEMELSLIGLNAAGKTSLVNVLATGSFSEDMIPTVGFNMRKVTKGNVAIKLWDLGGQTRFRSMWERYCRGVNAIVFVVDAADHGTIDLARNELHNLLKPQEGKDNPLAGIPLLVLGNKKDLPGALGERELIERMDLQMLAQTREVCTYCISCKNMVNIDLTLEWLTSKAKGR